MSSRESPPAKLIDPWPHNRSVDSFRSYVLRLAYGKVERLGDRLARVDGFIDWEALRPIVAGLYDNKGPQGGRPNVDEVVMVKLLVLQSWYGLSDPELERQVADRLSFQWFLGFPDSRPLHSLELQGAPRRIR